MGSNATTRHLVSALCSTFCRTAIPDTLWSDGWPQFTSKEFNAFATQWGFTHQMSSPTYPQSNGKVEATVRLMKKIPGITTSLMTTGCAKPSSNTATLPRVKTASCQLISCMATLFRTVCQPILLQSGNAPCRKQTSKQPTHCINQRHTTIPMRIHSQTLRLD